MRSPRRYHERPAKPRAVKTVHPRALKPPIAPPTALLLHPPALPENATARLTRIDDQSNDEILRFFEVSTHIIPAAYPRLAPFVSFSELERRGKASTGKSFPGSDTKESRIKRSARISEELLKLRNDWAKGRVSLDGSENRLLWNVVNRYTRRGSNSSTTMSPKRKPVTLVLAHATGMPKETWEPFLCSLCKELEGNDDVLIDEAWAIEAINHGDSFVLNADKVGVLFDWSEHARDILNFLRNYLPDKSSSMSTLPVHLASVPEDVGHSRSAFGFRDRTVVGIGHSFGGCASVLAAVNMPKLFTSLILADPVIVPEYKDRTQQVLFYASISLQRQESWSSRDEALKLLRKSPVFAAWHPSAILKYAKYGLVTRERETRVKLKMSGLQEAITFVDIQASYEAFELLEGLDENVDLLWVMASKNSGLLNLEEEKWQVWRRSTNCDNVCTTSGHLIVQEAPDQLGALCSILLDGLS
ncbi:hypothetical protein SCHPADRAFT_908983 [Schizopora paradoxa]|uniref:AB hydrolase-1 domain-containing protein n=1 Tax=Schizopora paradoxa TaxID=27342 RepID=A0A0H2R840_9AGAM|nr:hypothetical protein SCHPADRAFT_908983 [Schizopora paradoxa]